MPADENTDQRYRFGPFVLDTDRGMLFRGDHERRLRPQSFEVLHYLLKRHGHLVSKEELHDAVWAGRAVTDDSLTQCLIDIRKALGDNDRTLVRTVPRRGYLFSGDVVVEGPWPDSPPGWRIAALRPAAAIVAAAAAIGLAWLAWGPERAMRAPDLASIAVLPFADLSADQDRQYLGDGLSEDLIVALGQQPELHVTARTSSFAFASQGADIATIRRQLNVAYVLEGSVRDSGGQLRVTAQLIDTSDSSNAWSQSYDTSSADLHVVQQDIVSEIIRNMLGDAERVTGSSPVRVFSSSDLMAVAREREIKLRNTPEVDEALLESVIDLYEQVVRQDPNTALGYSRLARAHLYGGDLGSAAPYIFRALDLDPDISEVQETLGNYYLIRDPVNAGPPLELAIELNPNNADAIGAYGFWVWLHGDTDRPDEIFERALALDPLALSRYADLGHFLANEARLAETDAIIERVLQTFDGPDAYRLVARLLELVGRNDEAIAWTLRAHDSDPGNDLYLDALAEMFVDIGDVDTALALTPEPGPGLLLKLQRYDDFVDEAEFLLIDDPRDIHLRYLLAFAYNVIGRSPDAVRILEDAGLPDDSMPLVRQVLDFEAMVTLANAYDAVGAEDKRDRILDWWLNGRHTTSPNWWRAQYQACVLALRDDYDAAAEYFERINDSPRLPWKYLVIDSPCLEPLHDDPRYVSVVARMEARFAAMRAQIPATLERFGVSLPVTQSAEK